MIKLGVIGMSPGNGHPYSWSAICNGYNKEAMATCPFPGIPEYLGREEWPKARILNVEVTSVFTQDILVSKHLAAASKITQVCSSIEELISSVDAVLLARDDAENRLEFALPIIKSGLPVFIDKPFAMSRAEADLMLSKQSTEMQIFTCSSLRYANELFLSENEKTELGNLIRIEASTPKYWNTYAVHLLEPLIAQFPNRGQFKNLQKDLSQTEHSCFIWWENLQVKLTCTGANPSPIQISYMGEKASMVKQFKDSFSCFKKSIETFLVQIEFGKQQIKRSETLEIVDILEQGK